LLNASSQPNFEIQEIQGRERTFEKWKALFVEMNQQNSAPLFAFFPAFFFVVMT
jgi:hypothetical protein